ncbi:MAG: peptidase T [Acidobacteriota bacterium]
MIEIDAERLKDRFIRYARINTQSADGVEDRYPSTPQQLEFAKLLERDLVDLGLADVRRDEHGYVTATLPASPGCEDRPTVGLLAHYDTYFGTSGDGVKPIVHVYEGGDIVLPDDPDVKITAEENPDLALHVGDEIITASGTTLLGADDKAGLAEILEAVAWLIEHPEHPRPRLRLGFTPDEEVGHGTKYFDVAAFGADVAYTMDGSTLGEVENETFCADMALVTIVGRDVHPGYAKGKMINALRVAARLIESIPQGMSPECTEGREGYLHPVSLEGNTGDARVAYIVRDFEVEGLERLERYLEQTVEALRREFEGARIELEFKEQYRNMKLYLEKEPRAVQFALEAVRAAGVEPKLTAIRGGTDGARLSAMGLPTPNIFAGGINFHSKFEWVGVATMVKATETILHLVRLWAEKG